MSTIPSISRKTYALQLNPVKRNSKIENMSLIAQWLVKFASITPTRQSRVPIHFRPEHLPGHARRWRQCWVEQQQISNNKHHQQASRTFSKRAPNLYHMVWAEEPGVLGLGSARMDPSRRPFSHPKKLLPCVQKWLAIVVVRLRWLLSSGGSPVQQWGGRQGSSFHRPRCWEGHVRTHTHIHTYRKRCCPVSNQPTREILRLPFGVVSGPSRCPSRLLKEGERERLIGTKRAHGTGNWKLSFGNNAVQLELLEPSMAERKKCKRQREGVAAASALCLELPPSISSDVQSCLLLPVLVSVGLGTTKRRQSIKKVEELIGVKLSSSFQGNGWSQHMVGH